jgi:hypothetical protein
MLITPILEQGEELRRYKIYVDLDGVLVDFDKQVERIGFPRDLTTDKKLRNKFWQTIGWMASHGKPFWGDMDLMPDAMQLWSYLKKYNPEILSATGTVGNAPTEKRGWVFHHLGNVKVHLTQTTRAKAEFAAPNHILIDDRNKAIGPWTAAGGIGILHTSAANTIAQLKELGL